MSNVFVYGTLLNPHTRAMVIGRQSTLYGEVLEGYEKVGLDIVETDGEEVSGGMFEVTKDELAMLDTYEGVASGIYQRIEVTLASGEKAFAYQKVDPNSRVLQEIY